MVGKPNSNKIAMFLPSLGGGGAEKSVVRLAVALSSRGLPIDLVLASALGPVRQDVPSSIRVIDLGRDRVRAAIPGLIRYLQVERPAVLFSAMYHANLVAIIAHALAHSRARLVISERGSFAALQRSQRNLKERTLRGAMRIMYRRADAITTVSKALKNELVELLGLPPNRIHPIYSPVISDSMLALADQDPEHPWLGQETPVIVAAGRLAPEKDYPTLLRAVAEVALQRPVRLIILGDGPLKESLIELVKVLGIGHCVDLVGRQSNPWSYMKRASVFVLSSISEGMPTALVEAMALGTRVVSTDCPTGPREILGEQSRALIPIGDPQSLAAAIIAAIDDPNPAAQPSLEPFFECVATIAYQKLLLGNIDFATSNK